MGGLNQNVSAVPTTTYGSSGDEQSKLVYTCANSSTAYFAADLTTTYNGSCAFSSFELIQEKVLTFNFALGARLEPSAC